ncbi:short-chain dehydrogenase/reductase SDR [Gemmatirosa kalamazoonensis]|uniref:Short-chain dehydrogenase/reductase SDR n=1 Tax=Gemmatirosa kalamazoonensis TaxID=861299 RepID=W0RM55_9BACT|nr:SDR family oxidoreductase [Gemmatirosa kalamazoonensis]AHG91836.1 short-chain dehydrogenase/reductase SDR [Gemmatirosa kalamazoonensis]
MHDDLSGRTGLITGAARGIGAETARQLAARGARLALVGLEPERLAALAESLGTGHTWAECDVTDQAALERAVESSVAALGGLDVVFANAGIAARTPVGKEPVEALARTIEVNLVGVVRTVCATLPHVTARRGYYLLMSSAAAIAPLPGMAAYAASKAGVEHFANAFRLEVAHRGVAVGVAHPCWIDTDLVRDARADLASFDATLKTLPGPFGTVTPVAECAAALVDAIVRRRRKVFVPRSLAPFAAFRQALASPLAERISARIARRMMPTLERESAAVGSAFGEHSVERGRL